MLDDAALIEDYRTMSMKEMARKHGVSLTTIFRHLQYLGVETVKSAVKGVAFTRLHREVLEFRVLT